MLVIWCVQQNSIGNLDRQIQQLNREIARLPTTTNAVARLNLRNEQVKLERDRIDVQNGVYHTLSQGCLSILGGGLVYAVWQYLRRTEAQLQLANERQLTDRFSQAIAHLASDKLEVRLGGIYTLELLAHESPDRHGLTSDLLTAFVHTLGWQAAS